MHNHGGGDFCYGISSSSYIESFWHSLKSKILGTYKHIPTKYFISYLKEAEFKVKNNDKNGFEIIKVFFECFYHNENLLDIIVEKDEEYLSDEDFNKEESDSDLFLLLLNIINFIKFNNFNYV